MKKIAVLVTVAFLTIGTCFADSFSGKGKLIESYLLKGQFIKLEYPDGSARYYHKSTVPLIYYSDSRIRITDSLGAEDYSPSDWDITLDSENNLILIKKSKKK